MDFLTPLSNHLSSLVKMFTLLSSKEYFFRYKWRAVLTWGAGPPICLWRDCFVWPMYKSLLDPPLRKFLRCSCDIRNGVFYVSLSPTLYLLWIWFWQKRWKILLMSQQTNEQFALYLFKSLIGIYAWLVIMFLHGLKRIKHSCRIQ